MEWLGGCTVLWQKIGKAFHEIVAKYLKDEYTLRFSASLNHDGQVNSTVGAKIMKTDVLLSDFIAKVKEELVTSQCKPEEAFYELTDVELEVSFALATTGKTKGKLVVIELGGGVTASQTHHIRLKLKPVGNKFQSNSVEKNAEHSVVSPSADNHSTTPPVLNEPKKEKTLPVAGSGHGRGFSRINSSLEEGYGPLYQKY